MAGGGCRERRCHDGEWYLGEQISIRLPTVQFMEDRLLELGPGAYMFKTDLAQGYRQLRIDPSDWPLLGFQHEGKHYLDICPPFGLKTSALFMKRTSEAISHIHGKQGHLSRPYLDLGGGGGGGGGQRRRRRERTSLWTHCRASWQSWG